jgi:hypothetical protein
MLQDFIVTYNRFVGYLRLQTQLLFRADYRKKVATLIQALLKEYYIPYCSLEKYSESLEKSFQIFPELGTPNLLLTTEAFERKSLRQVTGCLKFTHASSDPNL